MGKVNSFIIIKWKESTYVQPAEHALCRTPSHTLPLRVSDWKTLFAIIQCSESWVEPETHLFTLSHFSWLTHSFYGKTWRVSCRASWSYGIWGLISYSIVSHCWFHYSITFQVVARRSVTLSAQLFNMFSVAFLEGGSTSKQIIEYCITPESLIVITQNCLGIKYANMSRKIINVTANSDYTEGWKKGIREFKRIF